MKKCNQSAEASTMCSFFYPPEGCNSENECKFENQENKTGFEKEEIART